MSRLSRAGFAREFIRHALLPDWWDDECERDPALVRDVLFRVARFLDAPLEVVEGADRLDVPRYPNARLRRVKNVDADKLGAAIHAGLQIARAAVRSLRNPPPARVPSANPAEWIQDLLGLSRVIDLRTIVADLWARGIPVVQVELLPAPKFQALACVVEGRPVILVGHGYDEPARLAVLVAHEVGHVVHGHCEPGVPVIDEEDVPDTSEIERTAEDFAGVVLAAGEELPMPALTQTDPRALANAAMSFERSGHVDAGVLLWYWANRTNYFQTAQLALKALYRNRGGRRMLREHFDRWIDLEGASDTDRALLQCVFLSPGRDEPAD